MISKYEPKMYFFWKWNIFFHNTNCEQTKKTPINYRHPSFPPFNMSPILAFRNRIAFGFWDTDFDVWDSCEIDVKNSTKLTEPKLKGKIENEYGET